MKNTVKKPTFRLAFCSVIAALEVVLMLIAGLSRFGTYAFPCFAGLLAIAVVIEYGCKWGFGVFAVAAVLSFFLSADKEAVVLFIAIFGYYPILKNILERKIVNPVLCWVVKFLVFNAAAVASFYVGAYLLGVSPDEFVLFGVYVPFVFLIAGNVFFMLYDMAINIYVKFYVQRLRKMILGRFL